MTWWVALSNGIGLLLVLLFLGIPVFVSFLVLNVAGILVLMGPAGFGLFANSIYTTATITALATVPLFIIMGEILFRSGAMEAVFDSLDRLIGRIRGRQYVLCILLSAILGALSGAAMAVAGLLGRSLLPEMLRRGYNRRLSAGVILAGACLDPIIPPSVLAILIATLAEISTASLLIAGIIPGLMLMCLFLVYTLYRVWRDPSLAPELSTDLADGKSTTSVPIALVRLVPCAFVFLMVMGLIMLGVATPTEAAATGVFGAIVVAVIYGKFSLRMIWDSLIAAATVSALLLVIMCCAVMFSQLLTFTGATRAVAELVAQANLPPVAMLFLMMALPFVLFMFLDQLALMLVLIPIYQPLIKFYAFDSIWFWTLFLIVATVGGLTPPFGYVLFALKSAAPNLPTTEIYRASWPFVWLIVLGMAILVMFPSLVTFLPNLARPA
jgi:tripartite ATP-independent transporter DctM subunit